MNQRYDLFFYFDNNGKMRIDWNDPNIFKAIGIPFVGGLSLKNNE